MVCKVCRECVGNTHAWSSPRQAAWCILETVDSVWLMQDGASGPVTWNKEKMISLNLRSSPRARNCRWWPQCEGFWNKSGCWNNSFVNSSINSTWQVFVVDPCWHSAWTVLVAFCFLLKGESRECQNGWPPFPLDRSTTFWRRHTGSSPNSEITFHLLRCLHVWSQTAIRQEQGSEHVVWNRNRCPWFRLLNEIRICKRVLTCSRDN